jgi:hypothetical protein
MSAAAECRLIHWAAIAQMSAQSLHILVQSAINVPSPWESMPIMSSLHLLQISMHETQAAMQSVQFEVIV